MRVSGVFAVLLLGLGIAASSAVGCQGATQVDLTLSTDIPCSALHSISINVAPTVAEAENDIRAGRKSIASAKCDPSGTVGIANLGNLFIVPGSGGGGGIVVRAGVRPQDTQKCVPPDYNGCVVSKRLFTFTPHETRDLPVRLPIDCLDFPCESDRTCIAKDVCVPIDMETIPVVPSKDAGALDSQVVDATPPLADANVADVIDAGPPVEPRESFSCASVPGAVLFCESFDDLNHWKTEVEKTFITSGGKLATKVGARPTLNELVSSIQAASDTAYFATPSLAVTSKVSVQFDVRLPAANLATPRKFARLGPEGGPELTLGWDGSLVELRLGGTVHKYAIPPGWHRLTVARTQLNYSLVVDGTPLNVVAGMVPQQSPVVLYMGVLDGTDAPISFSFDNIYVTNL